MTFTLNDVLHVQPILEVQLPSSLLTEKSETCHCVNLKDSGISLEPNAQYRWYISMRKNPESHSEDIVGGGVIERCDVNDCLITLDVLFGCDLKSVKYLARQGFWYDSISCLCDLIKTNPDDKELRRLLLRLLGEGGLRNVEPDYLDPVPAPPDVSLNSS